jgi:hypothetical protein
MEEDRYNCRCRSVLDRWVAGDISSVHTISSTQICTNIYKRANLEADTSDERPSSANEVDDEKCKDEN